MNLKDILELVRAGYTKEEITGMTQVPNPEPTPAPVDDEVPVPAPAPAPAPAPQPVPEPENNQPTMSDIMQGIAKLTSAIQANAIAQSVLPAQNPQTAEDMLAEIIRPTFKERSL